MTWLLPAVPPPPRIPLSPVYLGEHWPSAIVAGPLVPPPLRAAGLWRSQRGESLPALAQPQA
ncbi:bifunctional DedA family/phosphatase PAP2 family protein, partial [Pseudomonas aeruginosa]